jgi:hypothetical protein
MEIEYMIMEFIPFFKFATLKEAQQSLEGVLSDSSKHVLCNDVWNF